MRILLVDDEEELVATMAERLNMRGIETDWAISGESALVKVQQGAYDLAVLDIKMPRMGGLELKNKLQLLQHGMKFIFLTGHGSEHDFREGTEAAGADNYLIKPVAIDMLVAKIQEILASAPQQQ